MIDIGRNLSYVRRHHSRPAIYLRPFAHRTPPVLPGRAAASTVRERRGRWPGRRHAAAPTHSPGTAIDAVRHPGLRRCTEDHRAAACVPRRPRLCIATVTSRAALSSAVDPSGLRRVPASGVPPFHGAGKTAQHDSKGGRTQHVRVPWRSLWRNAPRPDIVCSPKSARTRSVRPVRT